MNESIGVGGDFMDVRKRIPTEGHASACPGGRHQRRHPAHLSPSEEHNRSIKVFVTACSAKRRKILATAKAHGAIVTAWNDATGWLVGRYVIMPDHVHFFCTPNCVHPSSLEKWMKFWKSLVTRRLGQAGGTLWQRHHWDRQLRRGESYDDKWEYVRTNSVRHGLVTRPEDWRWQGVVNDLRW